jgi:hypothetical protein
MIWESQPWKVALRQDVRSLRRLADAPVTDKRTMKYERTLFLAAFSIRKLIEANKLTDRVARINIKCRRIPVLDEDRIPDRLNWHRIEAFYDLSKPEVRSIPLKAFTNQIIHSFIFIPEVQTDDGQLSGFLVSSDFDRKKCLYQFEFEDILQIIEAVATDDIVQALWERDANGELQFSAKGQADATKPGSD